MLKALLSSSSIFICCCLC